MSSPSRRTFATLIAWGVAILVLAILGSSVSDRLSQASLAVPGSPAWRAEALLRAKFGSTIPMAVLLRGPAGDVERQGRKLAAALRRTKEVEVLSPWERTPALPSGATRTGARSAMRRTLLPHPGTALVLATYMRGENDAKAVVLRAEAVVARTVSAPVHSYLAGIPAIGIALERQTLKDTDTAETIAVPALIIVLLLVFGSPLAAVLPLVMGGATIFAGHGLLWIATYITPINSLTVSVAAMMALALGVDYSLLMISRVRQELANGCDHERALANARKSAGRTIFAAGGALSLVIIATTLVATPGLLIPVAVGVVTSSLLSVALALSALPALLHVAGPSLDRWQIRRSRGGADSRGGRARALAERLIARPAITIPLILASMLALASPAAALRMGPPSAAELPPSSPAREATRMVQQTMGEGWTAPFVIVASARKGAITTTGRLHALTRFQEKLAKDPDVAAVLGPASVAGATSALTEAHAALASTPGRLTSAKRGVKSLRAGLRRASTGVQQLREGLTSAANGAASLRGGTGRASSGAQRIADEDERARGGAQKLTSEDKRAQSGAKKLTSEDKRARSGAKKLTSESERASEGARKLASESELASEGAGQLGDGLTEAASGSASLVGGLQEASTGAERLASSDGELTSGAAQLAAGIDTLDALVPTALTPIEHLASQLHSSVGLIESLQTSHEQVVGLVQEAKRELEAIMASDSSPQGAALAQDLAAIAEKTEESEASQLKQIEAQLDEGLHTLSKLPDELAALTTSMTELSEGADRLATGTKESEEGASSLSLALYELVRASHTLSAGLSSLTGGAGELASGLGALAGGNSKLASGIGALHSGNSKLASGLGALAGGNSKLASGLGALAGANSKLAGGIGALHSGNSKLASGLTSLTDGTGELASGLTSAGTQTRTLATGLAASHRPLQTYETMLATYQHDYELLHEDSPHALDSGYLVLALLDGTTSTSREQVAQMVNVDGGGQATRMIVVAKSGPDSAASARLSARLRRELPALGKSTGTTVKIGQGAQYLLDYTNANTSRFPWLIFVLTIVALLALIVILRALLLALIAVALNLLTIFAALGVLMALTDAHVIGGPGYIDAASGAGITAIMFALSIDYEVFLLTRMRERWLQREDNDDAIAHGLRHTAGVITGSAAIMIAVFLAFSIAPVVPLQQFGIGLTIAVLLDATVVRLVLLPAAMRLFGRRVWWMPRWLEHLLPSPRVPSPRAARSPQW
ncbi:MAG TPA: MMPL family transporter [Solirubrobacteraceae bacterium]|jgi:RND superfamily putative drug exporter